MTGQREKYSIARPSELIQEPSYTGYSCQLRRKGSKILGVHEAQSENPTLTAVPVFTDSCESEDLSKSTGFKLVTLM